ncbi:hypothetical protein N7451_012601 [Penicillium sp. IBT 35674x]|nr:hypothetical protein N7451_012601 [Penicillium sp. IBT 35674x]
MGVESPHKPPLTAAQRRKHAQRRAELLNYYQVPVQLEIINNHSPCHVYRPNFVDELDTRVLVCSKKDSAQWHDIRRYQTGTRDADNMNHVIRSCLVRNNHPNILSVSTFYTSYRPEYQFVVSEHTFATLQNFIDATKASPLPTHAVIVPVMRQILDVLYFLLGHRLQHSQITPHNILFNANGVLKLVVGRCAAWKEASSCLSNIEIARRGWPIAPSTFWPASGSSKSTSLAISHQNETGERDVDPWIVPQTDHACPQEFDTVENEFSNVDIAQHLRFSLSRVYKRLDLVCDGDPFVGQELGDSPTPSNLALGILTNAAAQRARSARLRRLRKPAHGLPPQRYRAVKRFPRAYRTRTRL